MLHLTSSTRLVSWRGATRLALAHSIDGNDPELVIDKGGQLQDD